MALPRSYLTSSKNLTAILNAIRSAQAPQKFTLNFLQSLEFASSADRLIIGVLKSLNFLTAEGQPTERYFKYLDQTQSETVMAEAIRDAYSDLFQVNRNANAMSQQEVVNKLKTLGQGQFSESVLDKMAMTFSALVKHADFKSAPPTASQNEALSQQEGPASLTPPLAVEHGSGHASLGGLHYNIQIILPETRDTVVYDAIFRSLREHLV